MSKLGFFFLESHLESPTNRIVFGFVMEKFNLC